jgi:hypothetical protein
MRRVHDAYVKVVFNPFYDVTEREKVTSVKFDTEVDNIGREWKVSG